MKPPADPAPSTGTSLRAELRRFAEVGRRNWWGVALVFVVGLGAAFLTNRLTERQYRASAILLVQTRAPNVLPGQASMMTGPIEDQVIRSTVVAREAVNRLARSGTYLEKRGAGGWEVLPDRLLGRPLAKSQSAPVTSDSLRGRLEIERGGNSIVTVSLVSPDPAFAAAAVNAMADAFVDHLSSTQRNSSVNAEGWLIKRIEEEREKIRSAQAALGAYQEQAGISNLESEAAIRQQQIAGMLAELATTRSNRLALQADLEASGQLPQSQWHTLASVAASPAIQEAQKKVAGLRTERERLARDLGEAHPTMVQNREEITDATRALDGLVAAATAHIKVALRHAIDREAFLQSEMERLQRDQQGLQDQLQGYNLLKKDLQVSTDMFDRLTRRARETDIEGKLEATNVAILERADTPSYAVFPDTWGNYRRAMLLSLMAAAALVFFLERMHTTIGGAHDLAHLTSPVLGQIPVDAALAQRGGAVQDSMAAEAYRLLRTNVLMRSARQAGGQALMVTSANPGEGKSTTAANLARAFSRKQLKTLMVDVDVKHPTGHVQFNTSRHPGLTDLLLGHTDVETVVRRGEAGQPDLIVVGSPCADALELIGSERMREALQGLRERYDWVILDAPPVLVIAEVLTISEWVENLLLVVSSGHTKSEALAQAIHQVELVGGRVTGLVLNRLDPQQLPQSFGAYYGDYYARDSERRTPSDKPARPFRAVGGKR